MTISESQPSDYSSAKLSIGKALQLSEVLASASDSARVDIEVLLAFVLQKDRAYLYTWPEKELSAAQQQHFLQCVEQRQQGQPVAYIVGEKEFWSLRLEVNKSTLIPRPDTELLVETVLDLCSADDAERVRTVVDLGTGTGAIALALASEKARWRIIAIDTVPDACELAEKNRLRHQLNHVDIICGDWLNNIAHHSVDVIVSNPPYIDAHDSHLQQGDVRFEPTSALIAKNAGLADIERITQQATQCLVAGGWLLFEHGYQQAQEVSALLSSNGFLHVQSKQDMAGHLRVTFAQWPASLSSSSSQASSLGGSKSC